MSTRSKTATRNAESGEIDLRTILGGISNKLDNIVDVLHEISFQHRKEYEQQETSTQAFQSSMTKIQQDVNKVIVENKKRSARQNVLTNRRKIESTWQRQLNKRSQLYWQCMNAENTAVIYETWANDDKKIIPRKFLMKDLPNESQEESDIRRSATLRKLNDEINLLKIRAERHKQKYENVDAEMNASLKSQFNEDDLADIKGLWREETAIQESKSSQRWMSKQQWLEKYAEEFNNAKFTKPKSDRRRNHPKKQHQREGDETPINNRSSSTRHARTNTSHRTNYQNAQRTTNSRNPNHAKENPRPNHNTRVTRNTMPQQRRYQPTEREHKSSSFTYPMTYAEVTKASPLQRGEQATSNNHLNNNRMQNYFLNPPFASNHVPHPMMYHHLHGLNNNQFGLPTITNLPSNQR